MAYSQGIPATETALTLSESFYNFKFIVIQIFQHNNLWASMLVPSSYFDGTNSSGRVQLRNFYSDSIVDVYKLTRTSVAIKSYGSTDLSGNAYHVGIIGLLK